MTEPLEKPLPPADDDCCGGSCSPCVWDSYFTARREYNEQQELLSKQAETPQPSLINT